MAKKMNWRADLQKIRNNREKADNAAKRAEEKAKKLAQRQEDMDANIREIKKDVGQMAQKAGRRWDMIVEKAIAAIVGALVGFLLLKLGLG